MTPKDIIPPSDPRAKVFKAEQAVLLWADRLERFYFDDPRRDKHRVLLLKAVRRWRAAVKAAKGKR